MSDMPKTWQPIPENVEKLYQHMAHGDEQHRRWLREHLYAYFGLTVPKAEVTP